MKINHVVVWCLSLITSQHSAEEINPPHRLLTQNTHIWRFVQMLASSTIPTFVIKTSPYETRPFILLFVLVCLSYPSPKPMYLVIHTLKINMMLIFTGCWQHPCRPFPLRYMGNKIFFSEKDTFAPYFDFRNMLIYKCPVSGAVVL